MDPTYIARDQNYVLRAKVIYIPVWRTLLNICNHELECSAIECDTEL